MVDTSKYEAVFNVVDANDDGRIDAHELKSMMSAMGEEVTDERAEEMVRQIDTAGDGTISLEEFAAFMER
jgi:Ca2+-binding EF-hand superfamily protein